MITNNNPLGTESIGKLLLKFSVPVIVGMTVNGLRKHLFIFEEVILCQ